MSDLGIEVLPPGRYAGRVEKVRYTFTAITRITITSGSTRRTASAASTTTF